MLLKKLRYLLVDHDSFCGPMDFRQVPNTVPKGLPYNESHSTHSQIKVEKVRKQHILSNFLSSRTAKRNVYIWEIMILQEFEQEKKNGF